MPEPTPMQWQPIDTVPKDGTWVLLYTPCNHRGPDDQVVWAARWAPGWDGGLYVERWSEDGNNVSYLPTEPTHWMPCPGTPFPRNRLVVEEFNIPKQGEVMNQLQRDALSLTRSPDFRWMDGMFAEWDPPTGAGGAVVLMQCARVVRLWNGEHRLDLGVFDLDTPIPTARNIRPVLTDPATLGCLAALVRDIAGTSVQVVRNGRGMYTVQTFLPARGMQTNGLPRTYDTEADGWVAAFKEVTTK